MKALKNSRYIARAGLIMQHHGLSRRLLLVTKLAGLVMVPGPGIRRGEIDPDDIKNFPPHLKRLLKVKSAILIVGVFWMAAIYVFLEIE
ncbi:hypothetical protein [Pseudomonas sp. R5(2019)]|uniref:hypothetical protein n=1 Tax=Pseudomonas sp. R5(2019) TaxID=2697566 RepID=UPI002115BC69|nr:hypothetical protein [Pseudomonas sp. R5(2019)]